MNKKFDKQKKIKKFKYNEDDILEILTEYLSEASGFDSFHTHAVLLGTPSQDLRLIAVVGESEDNSIEKINLEEIDREMDFNGTHKEGYYSDTKSLLKSLDETIKKGDF